MAKSNLVQFVKADTYFAAVTSVNQVLDRGTAASATSIKAASIVEAGKDGLQYIVSIAWD